MGRIRAVDVSHADYSLHVDAHVVFTPPSAQPACGSAHAAQSLSLDLTPHAYGECCALLSRGSFYFTAAVPSAVLRFENESNKPCVRWGQQTR